MWYNNVCRARRYNTCTPARIRRKIVPRIRYDPRRIIRYAKPTFQRRIDIFLTTTTTTLIIKSFRDVSDAGVKIGQMDSVRCDRQFTSSRKHV